MAINELKKKKERNIPKTVWLVFVFEGFTKANQQRQRGAPE